MHNDTHYSYYKGIQQIASDIVFHEFAFILFRAEKYLFANTIETASFLIKYDISKGFF